MRRGGQALLAYALPKERCLGLEMAGDTSIKSIVRGRRPSISGGRWGSHKSGRHRITTDLLQALMPAWWVSGAWHPKGEPQWLLPMHTKFSTSRLAHRAYTIL